MCVAAVPRGHNTRFKVHRIFHDPHKTQQEKVSQVEDLAEPGFKHVKPARIKTVSRNQDDSILYNSKKNDDVIIAESPAETKNENSKNDVSEDTEDNQHSHLGLDKAEDDTENEVLEPGQDSGPLSDEDEDSKHSIMPKDPQALQHNFAGSKTHPVHQAASMADVYFLGRWRALCLCRLFYLVSMFVVIVY